MRRCLILCVVALSTLMAAPLAAADLTGIWTGEGSVPYKDRITLTLRTHKGNYTGTISSESSAMENIPLKQVAFTQDRLLFGLTISRNRQVRVALYRDGNRLDGVSSVAGGEWKRMKLARTSRKLDAVPEARPGKKAVAAANNQEVQYHEFPRQKLKITDFRAKGNILDIGGGGEGIIGLMKPKQVVAIDLFERELADAPTGPLKIVMDATDLKFLDKSFSTATCFFTFMYMNEYSKEQTFREVRRVLAPKGRFFVWDVIIEGPNNGPQKGAVFPFTFTLPKGKVINTGYGVRWPKTTHDLAYYKAMAKKAGFRVVREKRWSQAFFLELESTAKVDLDDVVKKETRRP